MHLAQTLHRLDQNFDPRSISLNTEMGVLFRHSELTAEIRNGAQLRTDDQVHAAVRVVGRGALAAYPILPIGDRTQELTVYTR